MATRVTELVARLNNQVSQAAKDMAEDMGRAAQSSNDMSDAMDKANTTLRKVGQTATQQNKSFNGVEKATRNIEAAYDRLEKRLEDAADAFAKGKITVEQYNDILATQVTQYEKTEAREQKNITTLRDKSKQLSEVTTQTDKSTDCVTKNTGAIKLQSYQVAQIADEFHKWVDQIMAGGSALTATTYQLPNMVQAMGGVKNAAALVLDIMSGPTGLAFAAGSVGAAFYKMGSYAEEEESKLAKLSQQLRATRSDANNMADSITSAANSLEKMPGWDKTTARQVATTIGSTYNFTGGTSDIEALAKVAQDAGTVFGSLEDGLKAVQTAMVDPTAEIQALYQQHLPGVDAQLVEQVKRLQEAGEQGKAYALVMQHLTADTKDAAEQALTPFQQALDKLRAKTSPLLDAFQDLALAMGTTLLNSITSLLSLPIPAEKTTGGLAGSTVLRNDKHPEMVGMMQINTAFTPKYDVMTAKGNVDEGIMRFQNFLHQTGGNLDDALALYGGFKVGSAGGRQYAASVYGQDLSKLPSDSDALIKQESGRFNLSWGVSNLMRKVALQESGGYQYDQRSKPTSVSPADHATSAAVIDDHKSIAGGAGEAAGAGDTSSSWTAQQEELKARIQLLQKEQDSTTTGSVKWQEYNEALTQTKIALANTLSPQEQITQGMKDQNAGLAAQTGYWRNMAEVVAQFATQARGTGVDQTALSEALAAKQKQLAAAYDDGTVAVQRQAQAQAAMLSVAGSSEQAIQHATNYQQAYNEALEDFNPKTQAFAEAVKARTAALNSETDAQARFEQAQQNSGLQDNLSMIQAQTASIGQNADERSIALARMQAEIQEHRKFGAILPQEAQDYVDLSTRIAEASTEYEHQQQVMDDVTGSISDMADQLSDGVVQGFVQGTSSGMSFKSMLEGVDASMASLIARFAVINPLLNSLDGKSRTTLADIGNLFGDTSTGSSSASSVLSGYGEGNDITSSGWAYSPWEALNMKNQISSSSGSTTGGGMFAGLGNLFSGKAPDGSGIFSSVGSAVSSIGSYMGMAGAAFGIGDMIYNLVAPLFATRKKDYQYVSVGSDGQLDISGHVYKGIHGNDNVASGLQDDLDSINDVLGDTGISIANTGVIGKVGWTKKGKKSSTYSLTDLLPDLDLTSSDSTLNQALQQIMPSSFDSVDTFTQDLQSLKDMADTLDQLHVSVSKFDDQTHITVGHISDYTGDMAKVLSGFDGKTVSTSALESMISNLKSLLDLTNSGAESLVSQVADLRDKYQQAADQAKAYGLDYQVILDKGNAIAQSMLDTETTSLSQSDQSVQARYLAATGDQEGADLANFDVSAAQQRQELEDNWRSYLGDSYADNQTYAAQMADLDKTLAAERLQIEASYQGTSLAQQKEYLDQANESVASVFSNLTSYAQGLLTSDDSPLSTQDQYQVANDNLQSDYQAAMGGDYDALSRIQSDASSYLSLAKTWLGSGTDYAKAYQQTLSLLQSLSSMSTDQITATLMKKLSQESVNATLSVADQIGDLKTALQTELRQLARVMITKKSSLT